MRRESSTVRMTTDQFAALLEDITQRVLMGDSFGGNLTYEVTEEDGMWEVTGAYRIGNREGQGGTRLIVPNETASDDSETSSLPQPT